MSWGNLPTRDDPPVWPLVALCVTAVVIASHIGARGPQRHYDTRCDAGDRVACQLGGRK